MVYILIGHKCVLTQGLIGLLSEMLDVCFVFFPFKLNFFQLFFFTLGAAEKQLESGCLLASRGFCVVGGVGVGMMVGGDGDGGKGVAGFSLAAWCVGVRP